MHGLSMHTIVSTIITYMCAAVITPQAIDHFQLTPTSLVWFSDWALCPFLKSLPYSVSPD